MLPLLFPLLLDTVIAPPADYYNIFVNEWGVVVFNSMGASVEGAPDENGNVLYGRDTYEGDLLVDAPVIWVHGGNFDEATVTVKAGQGFLTTLFPEPDSTQGSEQTVVAEWHISSPERATPTDRSELSAPEGTPFAWAMDYWRDVPSLDLYNHETREYIGNFLYYEMGIPFWESPEGIYDANSLAACYSPEGLIITTGAQPHVERIQLIALPDGAQSPPGQQESLSDDKICEILCGWASGNLKSQEITALWQTWEPFFTTGGTSDKEISDSESADETWILVPLPWDVVEGISTINLEVHDQVSLYREITYNRLFLGLIRVR